MTDIKSRLGRLLRDDEAVTFYPGYGYRAGTEWIIPLRAWVHEDRPVARELMERLASGLDRFDDAELALLAERMADILADSESLERVVCRFDHDPDGIDWRICDAAGKHPRSDLNGVIEGALHISQVRAGRLLASQGSRDGWLSFRAVSREHSGVGRIRLLEPEGLSVISDIDDTLKETQIPAGARVVVRNTFFEPFAAAAGMSQRYAALTDAAFHYVSGSPWQLYRPLQHFLAEAGFPEGSFHMKSVPANLLSPATWKALYALTGDATITQKLDQIGTIMGHFPRRRFILVGDSGEHDPEVYAALRANHGDQIEEIWIRDVNDTRRLAPERLAGMRVIEAPSVSPG